MCESRTATRPAPGAAMCAATARILIAGQAPGDSRVHRSGIPFDDPSGDRLRVWMGIDRDRFYDPAQVAILPMGFCYPGTGNSGDLPPRPECADTLAPGVAAATTESRTHTGARPIRAALALRRQTTFGDRARKKLARKLATTVTLATPEPAQQPLAETEPLVREPTCCRRCRRASPMYFE